jgi:hypothetical protein
VSGLAGWTNTQGTIQIWNGLYGYAAADGTSWMQVDGKTSQTVVTKAGDALVLQFWYSPRPGESAASNSFQVVWNGTVIDALAPNGSVVTTPDWNLATYVVKATGNDTLSFNWTGNHATYGALLDAVSLVDRSASSATFASPPVNLSVDKKASASEIGYGSNAAAAVDGNVDGNFAHGSVVDTFGNNPQDYWEVDLGAVATVQSVNLFNRTDCCATRLNNFYVLVSQNSMDGQSLTQLLANPAVARVYTANTGFVMGNSPQLYSVNLGDAEGRYVRVQLAGTNQLALAEVQVMGWPAGAR